MQRSQDQFCQPRMRLCLILVLLVFLGGCSRDKKELEQNCGFTRAVITNQAPTCQGWGIVVGTTVYPSKNIPDTFKQAGLTVCTNYVVYFDATLCACCGGWYADILSMHRLN